MDPTPASPDETPWTYVPGSGWVAWDQHRLDVTAVDMDTTHVIEDGRCACCGQKRRRCREGRWSRAYMRAAAAAGRAVARA